jgi:hypothetical protein
MQVTESSTGQADSDPKGSLESPLPAVWSIIAGRLASEMTVPRGLLLRALPSSATLAQLVSDARSGANPERLATAVGLSIEHGDLVRAALLQTQRRKRPPRVHATTDPGVIARLRQEINDGLSIETIVKNHGFTPSQRLQYLIQSGLTGYAGSKRHQARREIPLMVAQGAEVPDALLCIAIGITTSALHEIRQALRDGEGLLQVMHQHHLPWPDARLIAQAIRWKPSWRKRELRVGRLSLEDVLRRAANNENPVWIAEAAGVRAQWIRQVLKREGVVREDLPQERSVKDAPRRERTAPLR